MAWSKDPKVRRKQIRASQYNLKKGERLYDVYYKAEGSDHFDTMLVRARSEKAAMKKAGSVLKYSTIHDAEERP